MGQGAVRCSRERSLESCSAILLAPFTRRHRKGAGEREGIAANGLGGVTDSDVKGAHPARSETAGADCGELVRACPSPAVLMQIF